MPRQDRQLGVDGWNNQLHGLLFYQIQQRGNIAFGCDTRQAGCFVREIQRRSQCVAIAGDYLPFPAMRRLLKELTAERFFVPRSTRE